MDEEVRMDEVQKGLGLGFLVVVFEEIHSAKRGVIFQRTAVG